MTGTARIKKTLTPFALRVIATAITFLLGLIGFHLIYADLPGKDPSLPTLAYRALELVFGKYPEELSELPIPVPLLIARYALPVLGWWTSINVAWLAIRNPIRLWWVKSRGNHAIVAGDSSIASRIVAGERAAGRPVIVWSDAPKSEWVLDAANQGAPHAGGDDQGMKALGFESARIVVIAGCSDTANIELGGRAIATIAKHRLSGDPLPVIARIDDPDLRAPLEVRFERLRRAAAVRLRLMSVPDVQARRIFLTQPLDRMSRLDEPARHLMVVGFSAVAERLLVRVLAGAHFRGGGKVDVTVLCENARHVEAVFRARRPGAEAIAPIEFFDAPVGSPSLLTGTLESLFSTRGEPSLVLADLEDREDSLPTALAIEEHFRRADLMSPPIVVRCGSNAVRDLSAALAPFGDWDMFSDPELMLQERHDDLARSIHNFYLRGRIADGEHIGVRASLNEWDDLPEAFRDDNRLVADLYGLKLRDVSARIVNRPGESVPFRPDELEELARAEHDRWKAAKLLDGWRHADARDDAKKFHPDLVDYDSLSERIKELDREQIRMITRLVSDGSRQVSRDLRLLVTGGTPGGLRSACLDLKTRFPERTLVIAGRLDDKIVRALLLSAFRDNEIVEVAAALNIDNLIDVLPLNEGAEVRTLLFAADSWLTASEDRLGPELEARAEFVFDSEGMHPAKHLAPAD